MVNASDVTFSILPTIALFCVYLISVWTDCSFTASLILFFTCSLTSSGDIFSVPGVGEVTGDAVGEDDGFGDVAGDAIGDGVGDTFGFVVEAVGDGEGANVGDGSGLTFTVLDSIDVVDVTA
jgi:hypothetical protein